MKRTLKALLIVVVILAVFSGSAAAFQIQPVNITLFDSGVFYTYDTMSETAGDLFAENNIVINPSDRVAAFAKDIYGNSIEIPFSFDMEIEEKMGFKIDRAAKVDILVDGQIITISTIFKTVGELLATMPQFSGTDYRVVGLLATDRIYDEMVIEIEKFITQTTVNTFAIPFKTETLENPEMLIGEERVVQRGAEGVLQIELLETYLGDEKVASTVNNSQVVSEAITEIIHIGTKRAEKMIAGNVYTKVMEVKATAYTAGEGARTYTGIKPYEGVISVDPRVIPLGTKVYVEGYGVAVAADTGKSIKGNKIDLFYDTYKEAINYGIRTVKIYFLD